MKLGDTIVLKVTPGLILAISKEVEGFIQELVKAEQIDLERECMAFARDIAVTLGKHGKIREEPGKKGDGS